MTKFKLLLTAASTLYLGLAAQAHADEAKNEIQKAFSEAFASSSSSANLTGVISKLYRELDKDGDGIEQSEIDLMDRIKQAQVRAQTIGQLLRYDLDGDGKVTRDEVEIVAGNQSYYRRITKSTAQKKRFKRRIKKQVDKILAQDPSGDGVITPSEYGALKPRESYARTYDRYKAQHDFARLLLSKDPNGDGKLEEIEGLKILLTALGDADINALLTRKCERLRSQVQRPANCKAPAASASAKVHLVGTYEGSSVPSVAVGGQDRSSSTAEVNIESGETPLYVVVTSHDTMIWRFTGAVDRVERVLVGGRADSSSLKVTGGVTGIAADRVSFLQDAKCLPYFYKSGAIKEAQAKATAAKLVGKKVDSLFGIYSLHRLALPSNQSVKARGDDAVEPLNLGGRDAMAYGPAVEALTKSDEHQSQWRSLLRFNPGGVVAIMTNDVVSNMPAENYKILPQESGLLQLVVDGTLEPTGRGEFKVTRKFRYPSGLGGAHRVKFLLKPGVPEPEGDPVHACVFSVDKGEYVEGNCR